MSSAVALALTGPFLMGTAANLILFGVNWQQVIVYAQSQDTRKLYRAGVGFVTLIGTFHTAISFYTVWIYSIETWDKPTLFAAAPWSFGMDPILTALVAFVVQLSYAWRIYHLGKRSLWLPVFILLLTLLQLAFGFICTIRGLVAPTWVEISTLKWAVGTWLAAMAVADIVITAAFTYYLRHSRTDFEETNSLLDKLVSLTVQNNGLTAVTAVCSAALFAADESWHLFFGVVIIKAYQVSFLSSLNARTAIAHDLAAARHRPRQNPTLSPLPLSIPLQGAPGTPAVTEYNNSRAPSLVGRGRPAFLRSKLAGSLRPSKEHMDHGMESLSVHVMVESETVEDSIAAEELQEYAQSDFTPSRQGSPTHQFLAAPFLTVPPPAVRGREPLKPVGAPSDMAAGAPSVQAFTLPFLLVTLADMTLLGINWTQLLQYFSRFGSSDRLVYRLSVLLVFLLCAVHTAFSITTVWHYLIESFGAPQNFPVVPWSFAMDPILNGTVGLVVQLHYVWKIWMLSERRAYVVSTLIIVLTAFQFAWYLRRARGTFAATDRLVDRIIGLTVANNALLVAVLFGTGTQGYQVGELLARLYILSFYSALNARYGYRLSLDSARLNRENHLSLVPPSFVQRSSSTAHPPCPIQHRKAGDDVERQRAEEIAMI
ncbi:hypothetical protein JCM10207_004881 [Rhodosporidiobolus poonsookiae]